MGEKQNSSDIETRLSNAESAFSKLQDLSTAGISAVDIEDAQYDATHEQDMSRPLFVIPKPGESGTLRVMSSLKMPLMFYNSIRMRFINTCVVTPEGHIVDRWDEGEKPEGEEFSYEDIHPETGLWYIWFNSLAYNHGKSGYGDGLYVYVTQEESLPQIDGELCRRPEVVSFPIFNMSVSPEKRETGGYDIEYLHNKAINLTRSEKLEHFHVAAYFYPITSSFPVLCYAVYSPKVIIHSDGKDADIRLSSERPVFRMVSEEWKDCGPYPITSGRPSKVVIGCAISANPTKGTKVFPPDDENKSNASDIVNEDEDEVQEIYVADYGSVSGKIGYRYKTNYTSLESRDKFGDMFSFPIAGMNGSSVSWAQTGYDDNKELEGTEDDQRHLEEMFCSRVDDHVQCLDRECTESNMLAAIKYAVMSGDLAVITYTGHGGCEFDEEGRAINHQFALPKDNRTVTAQEVANIIIHYAIGRVWLIYDMCYGGGQFDDEYDQALRNYNLGKGFVDEVVRAVKNSESKVTLLGWSASTPGTQAMGLLGGGEFITALYNTFDENLSYKEWWMNKRPIRYDVPYKKSCNGFNEEDLILN